MSVQTDVSDPAMAAAIEANYREAFKGFADLPVVHLHDSPQMVWYYAPEIPHPLPNGVMSARLPAGSADAEIDRITRHFQAHQLPALWWVWPSSQPDDLAERLAAHGWTRTGGLPGMAADLQQLPAEIRAIENFEIARVGDHDLLRQWHRVMKTGFALPEALVDMFSNLSIQAGFDERATWHNYVGLLDGQVVACASLIPRAGVAGIFSVATLPEARGSGIGSAITHHVMTQAKAKGYRVAILGASQMGYRLYQRLGFKEYLNIPQYLFSPAD